MSKARIRYQKQQYRENTVISVQVFTSQKTGAKYRVILDLSEMVYKIRNERTKKFVVKSKAYGHINVLKRTARAHLEKLGVHLNRESRDRTFGVVKAGMTQKKWEEELDKKKENN